MGRDNDNTVKTPARSEEGVTVDPINPNPGRRSSRNTSKGGKSTSKGGLGGKRGGSAR